MFGLCIRDNAAMFAWFFVSLDVLAANESYLIALLQVSGIGE